MLVLTRRINEKIIIGENVYVTVLGINGSQIRLGIDAPKEVSVHRDEIYLAIKNNPKNPSISTGNKTTKNSILEAKNEAKIIDDYLCFHEEFLAAIDD